MLHSDDGIEASANMGGCTCGACCAGEDIFRTVYANKSQQPRTMTLASPYPGGKLLAVTLTPSGLTLSKGVWSATLGTHEFEVKVAKNLTAGCCAGQGLILSVIKGNGTAFLSGGGTVFQRTLAPQEKIMIDTSSLVACDTTVDIGVRRAGSAMMMCCGGEGLFVCELTGLSLAFSLSLSLPPSLPHSLSLPPSLLPSPSPSHFSLSHSCL